MTDARKHITEAQPHAKPAPSAGPDVREPAAWSEYLEDDRREQEQLGITETLIKGALQDSTFWLLDNPSAEENAHVFALQERLGELINIISRRVKQTYSPKDGWRWSATVTKVLSLLEQIPNVIDFAHRIGLARLKEELPRELPGNQRTEKQAVVSAPEPASRVAKKLQDPKGNPTMTIREAAHAFAKSKATIYRWIEEGKLDKSGTPGRVRTDSVIRLLNPPPEQ